MLTALGVYCFAHQAFFIIDAAKSSIKIRCEYSSNMHACRIVSLPSGSKGVLLQKNLSPSPLRVVSIPVLHFTGRTLMISANLPGQPRKK